MSSNEPTCSPTGGEPIPGVTTVAWDPSEPWHSYTVEETLHKVQLSLARLDDGVPSADVERRGTELGNNYLPPESGKNVILMFLGHFVNSIGIILAVVAGVSAWLEDWGEFGVVGFVIIFNGLLGFWQEFSAEKSIQGLKNMSEGTAKVIRDGQVQVIGVSDCVIGDVVILEQGATVPTDMRLFEANNLEINEALLTGEVVAVTKYPDVIDDPEFKCALGDRKNMAYRYSTVENGRGVGITVAAGKQTEVGKIAKAIQSKSESSKTPLQIKMDRLLWALFGMCSILVVIVFGANRWDGSGPTILYAAAVAIAILPESLVAVITVAMTISVRRMAQDKCIVRKLAALEVLGNVTDICSDKTGTLTENKMVAQTLVYGTDKVVHIVGGPMAAYSVFLNTKKVQVNPCDLVKTPIGKNYAHCAALCTSTHVYRDGDMLHGKGNPTEIAVQVMCWKAQHPRETMEENEGWERRGEWSFDSGIKRMSVGYYFEGKSHVFSKGAPDRMLPFCTTKLSDDGALIVLTDDDRKKIDAHIDELGDRGLRCICFARRPIEDQSMNLSETLLGDFERDDVEKDLVYLGLIGILDPPRPSSGPSVRICQRAGIKVRMLTGDHTSTASAISRQLGILGMTYQLESDVMMGPDFDRMDVEDVDKMADLPSVIGRCSPDSKVGMIEALHRRGRIVAMTGDGFNDGPSIKKADVGCAMGSGTDVTKGVASVVITDDNFSTIVKAVAEGRRISSSISKFVVHLLSGNCAEVIVLILGLGIQLDQKSVFILSPIEILWLNMFTGSPPATGLSLDEADPDVLRIPPNTKGFFTKELIADTFIYGLFLGVCALCSFIVVLYGFNDGPSGINCNKPSAEFCDGIWTARSTAFSVLYIGLLLHAYNVRDTRKSVFRMKWFDNNWLWGSVVFGVVTLVPILYVPQIARYVFVHAMLTWEWAVVVIALIIFMTLAEAYKIIKNCCFPVRRVLAPPEVEAEPPEKEAEEHALVEEFARSHQDTRSTVQIAREDLASSFSARALRVARDDDMSPAAASRQGSFLMTPARAKA